MEQIMVWTYAAYLLLSLGLTVFVARTLHKNGRPFLVESFHGNEAMADSINHLLVVGFYLVNCGGVSVALKYGEPAHSLLGAIEYLSWKVGMVSLILGVMHFLNLAIFSCLRQQAKQSAEPRQGRYRYPDAMPVDSNR